MQHFKKNVVFCKSLITAEGMEAVYTAGRFKSMLRLTLSTEEYLMVGENVKIVFLGGTKNHLRIMVDAPKNVNIVRSTVLENKITDPEERMRLPRFYAEPETPKNYMKNKSGVIITKGSIGERQR